VRPVRMADAVRHHPRRMDENAPRAVAAPGAPCERDVLVRRAGVDAERIDDVRVDELPALVERTEFLAETVHRLTRRERERRDPLSALALAAEGPEPCPAAGLLGGDC